MDDLSEAARRLIDTAMGEDAEPPPDASWGAFVVHMTGMQPRSEEVTVAPPPKEATRRWPALVIVVAIAAAVGVWLVRRTPDVPQVEARTPTPTKSSPPPRTRESTAVPPPRKDAVGTPVERAPVESLIGDAEKALAAKDPTRALALLEEHSERAPLADAEQRMALRVLTLCALDRRDEAGAEARAFLSAHPDSKWAADVRRSCATE